VFPPFAAISSASTATVRVDEHWNAPSDAAGDHRRCGESFQSEVLEADLPVLVFFWAPWTEPCKVMAPVVDELSKDYEGRLKLVTLNTDDCPSTAHAWTIRGIPSLYIFRAGEVVETIVGAVPKWTLVNAISQHL
jgi:thioredoxin